nr:transcriptional regulator [bacterium]
MTEKRRECVLFGKKLRELREALGMSQEGFADQMEIHRTYLGGLERGERNPTLTVIVRVADALGVRPSELFELLEK